MQGKVLGKLSEPGGGEECPNQQAMFFNGTFWLKSDVAAVMSAGFLQPFLTRWGFQQLFAHWFLVGWHLPRAGRITSLVALHCLTGGHLLSPAVSISYSVGLLLPAPHAPTQLELLPGEMPSDLRPLSLIY